MSGVMSRAISASMTSAMLATSPTEIARRAPSRPAPCRAHVEIIAAVLQVALAQAPVDALGIDLDDERGRTREHARERLRAAHAAEARRQHEAAGERAAEARARPP